MIAEATNFKHTRNEVDLNNQNSRYVLHVYTKESS